MYTLYKYSHVTNRLTPFTLDLKNPQQYPHYFSFNLFKGAERALGQMKLVDCNLSYVSVDYCFFYESLPEYAYDLLYPIVLNRWHMNPTHFTKRKDWKNYQLLYTHKGAGILVWKGKIFHLKPDSLCLLDYNQYHYFYADDPTASPTPSRRRSDCPRWSSSSACASNTPRKCYWIRRCPSRKLANGWGFPPCPAFIRNFAS